MNVTIKADQLNAIHDTLRNRKRSVSADGIATDHLRSIVERIERLEREKTDLASDIKDIYTEAGIGSEGFVAIKQKRKFVGVELKGSYFSVACKNLANAEANAVNLFDLCD